MRTAKSTVKEICYTFKQEIGIHIVGQFSTDAEANEKMATLLFECYSSNLSRYCGHRQEGYCVAASPETVLHVHPSSALNYVEEWPQWVVYEKILTTSRPFMLNATFVKESWVMEKINSGKLKISMDRINEVVVRPHAATPVGGGFIGFLLQNGAQTKKNLEAAMRSEGKHAKASSTSSRRTVAAEASSRCIRPRASDKERIKLLADALSRKKLEVWNETVEEPLFAE
jgi:hypothetical protein